MPKPILDPVYEGKPHDWDFMRIQELKTAKAKEDLVFPPSWKNPLYVHTAPRDQDFRGTCVGQSTAYYYDLLYMELCGIIPSVEQKAQFKKNVIDSLGTTHDVLYPFSASAESFYQMSRKEGNVTYPAGSEIRFSARSWIKYGMNLESQWHTDKTGKMVWIWQSHPCKTVDGGISQADAAIFAADHRAEGYAQVGSDSNPSWEEVCYAIHKQHALLGAIPVYENYSTMEGGDGTFPDPRGELAGFHALCFYGYDADWLYFLHSWGTWCGRFGKISREFFRQTNDLIQFFAVLDTADKKIAEENYRTLTVTVKDSLTKKPIPADISVNGTLIGKSPQKFAVEAGKKYYIESKMTGYATRGELVDDSSTEKELELDPIAPSTIPWWQRLIEWLYSLFTRK